MSHEDLILAGFGGDGGVFVRPTMVKMFGRSDGNAAMLCCQMIYWSQRIADAEGWFKRKGEDFEEEIGLSPAAQRTARAKMITLGILEEELRGTPAKLWFRLNKTQLVALLTGQATKQPDVRNENLRRNPSSRAIRAISSSLGFEQQVARSSSNLLLEPTTFKLSEVRATYNIRNKILFKILFKIPLRFQKNLLGDVSSERREATDQDDLKNTLSNPLAIAGLTNSLPAGRQRNRWLSFYRRDATTRDAAIQLLLGGADLWLAVDTFVTHRSGGGDIAEAWVRAFAADFSKHGLTFLRWLEITSRLPREPKPHSNTTSGCATRRWWGRQ